MNSKFKQPMTPKLRFPEFRDAGNWNEKPLGDFSTPITERAGSERCVPMSVTAGVGLVSQEEKFGRTIHGKSYRNYYVLRKNDFAYNKSATKDWPQGFIARYDREEQAAVPNSIFTCFRICEPTVDPVYLEYLFLHNLHGRWLSKYITVGARAHGALSVSDDDLMALPVPLPPADVSLAEQQKIADCLTSADELIAAHGRKLAALKDHKKGLMQQLFPQEGETQPRLRFPEFQDAEEWEEKTLVDACKMQAGKFVAASEIKEQKENGLFPCYGGNGLRGFTATHTHDGTYPLIGRQGALCGNVKLASGRFHATEHAVVATPNQSVDVVWLYYLLDLLNLNRFATGQAQPGLSVDVLEKVPMAIPKDEMEQHRIADCLSALDDQISAQSRKIAALQQHKNGMMKQLFPSPEEERV